jgi:hypothetical protein
VSDSIRAALERLVFLDGCADQSPDWKQAWRDAMAAAQAALAGHDRQIGSSVDTGLLPMILSETGSDDEPETERIICSSISGGADYVNGMPRGLSLERHLGSLRISARYVQAPDKVAEPTPAPAGALKESLTNVWNEGFRLRRHAASDVIEVIARWLEHQQDIPTGVSADYFAALLRKEAGR